VLVGGDGGAAAIWVTTRGSFGVVSSMSCQPLHAFMPRSVSPSNVSTKKRRRSPGAGPVSIPHPPPPDPELRMNTSRGSSPLIGVSTRTRMRHALYIVGA